MASFEQSTEIGELAKALCAAQAEMQPAKFDTVNPHFKNRFASLASVVEAVKPLAKHGLSYLQQPMCDADTVGVRTMLMHTSGQWVASWCWSKPDRPGPQAMGSVITYLRRYSLSAITGIAADEDDDANVASHGATPKVALKEAANVASPKGATSAAAPTTGASVVPRSEPTPAMLGELRKHMKEALRLGEAEAAEWDEAKAIHVSAGDKIKAKEATEKATNIRRDAYLAWAGAHVGRKLGSTKELSQAEASDLIGKALRGEFATVAS